MCFILIIREVEYAIMILEGLYHKSPMSASELSETKNIPSPFIYRVLKKLEIAGILEIKRGPKGGYALAADCKKLTLYDVISAFENTFFVIECLRDNYECSRDKTICCGMHKEFERIQSLLIEEFRRENLESLFK